MNEPDVAATADAVATALPPAGAPTLSPQAGLSAQRRLADLRSAGAHSVDPPRFRYLEALSHRLQAQPEPVRRVLESRLHSALADYAERWHQAQPALDLQRRARRVATKAAGAAATSAKSATAADTPLAQLNQYLRQARADGAGASSPAGAATGAPASVEDRAEMASVRRFRETWARHQAEDQVDQAIGRGPENAGPFNSHRLIVQTLALMRDLSPDYLRRFLTHVDALQWLDQASEKYPLKKAVPAGRGVRKK